jgi:hypothetical protein
VLKSLQADLILLANNIQNQWTESTYDLEVFPRICAEALEKYSLHFTTDMETVLKEIPQLNLPVQTFPNGEFSDFPLTLVRTDKLLIDLYFWHKSDTTIHNHHFCGAFKVIAGESYQVNYAFNKSKSITLGFDEGTMIQAGNEHLSLGSVHPILLRDKFIHHVFHLGKPTITLCVRTPFLEGEGLAVFVYPKYRIVLSPLTTNQNKWLQMLQLQLEQKPGLRPMIPWDDGEVARILYRAASRQLALTPQVASYLLTYLEEKAFLPDFFELVKTQPKVNGKLKKFGMVTSPLKGQLD